MEYNNQDSELHQLCKKVYELTGWKYTIGRFHNDGSYDGYVGHRGIAYTPNPQNAEWLPKDIPLYSSDYLLDKLGSGAGVTKDSNGYTARRPSSLGASENKDPLNGRVGWQSDTAVKALLTMIIDLERVGIL